ncbi:2-amino-4-hydroxy-6-hydroxymethyldihydropteridine diphosphokinase [Shewanella yunxiaonensis]|uniref:2-amino-4-hydroxy-6-hydroxymethyldihydropteridine pyrophosphokinase n=1 Tax=Shewanella yunxiaonensis TaxID=2829809 RepID=A0ABX7YW28_9GAMM|nr:MULTISPECIES: 2-amino-4-hydroxy-6-hydroxymethyldihydropteridine diphosphokinase [Shewanella]MDF0533197.1 2-amino-4-hydroxy-6-hydroxymethyldihydropteridine diphosphokinase [Shewanella sp. A32]QUN06541.1 2-amino-4-hydroxy-6-hydroxymethyldihydropteridine diphosphokinase [Shewanella yunxiaonensis]
MPLVYVALGANLAQPQQQLDSACRKLTALATDHQLRVSSYYRSTPMGEVPQPDYVNAVASFNTDLKPLALLEALQAIELQQGRTREVRWGPRTLDLDLLLYGDEIIDLPRLKVPHYGLKQRAFVLVPLAELSPRLQLPCGTLVSNLIDDTMRNALQRLPSS